MRQFYVYIMASKRNGILYIGVTNNLLKRVYEHRNDFVDGFTKQYNVHDLVYYESFDRVEQAILREKRLKKWKLLGRYCKRNRYGQIQNGKISRRT